MTASLMDRAFLAIACGLALAASAAAQGTGNPPPGPPNYVISYIIQPSGNQTAVNNGGTLTFPATTLNNTATASFIIYNGGTGPGSVTSIAATGAAFKVSGLPLLPANLASGSEIRFTITFAPTARGQATGALTLELSTGRVTINLAGQGIGAALTYTASTGGAPTTLTPGATITIPTTNLGATSTVDIRVTNTGDAPTTVSTVSVSGAGLRLSNAPPLPATLPVNGSAVFTISFSPTTAGTVNGTVAIDQASFTVATVGLGSQLTFSSVVGSTTTAVQNNGTIVFPNTNVGQSSTVSVVISNAGNTAATISGVAVSGTGFSLPNPPKTPVTINPGASIQVPVAFEAGSTASVTGTLQIDSFGFNLRASGNPPPALSSVSFSNLPATIGPRQQPTVSLALAQPYPMDLSGKLSLSFTSDSFADDPAIQFASGGRVVNFTIPAGAVDAVFPSGKQVPLQTGTVAGSITVQANFSVASVDLTPNPAPSAKMAVQAAPPQLTNVQVGTRTANSFELLITGLSTPRQVSQINLQFTPAAGASLQTANLSINTDSSFSTWFQSSSGISFGSQFTASVIINVTGDINSVQSVAVTASNSRGDSNSMSANLR